VIALAKVNRAVVVRRLVVVCSLVLLVVGGFGTGRVSNRLTFDFALPGQSGYETAHRIEQLYGNGGEQAPSILVVSVPQGQTVDRDQARIATAIERLRRQQPRLRSSTTRRPRTLAS
jgi:RND superfamily putative drug exporter